MNAVIKLNNTHYLQVLEQLLLAKILPRDSKVSLVKLPFSNLMALLLSILTTYTQSPSDEPLLPFLLTHLHAQHPSAFELYRHMQGLITMWKKYVECHEQARLFLSLLQPERSSRESVRLFLKIRKAIIRNLGPKLMQEIMLTHEDIITLSHTIFTPEMKAFTSKKIHEMFLSLKKKSLYSNQKINGAVVCQFFMNCAERFERQELDNIKIYFEHSPKQTEEFLKKRVFKPLQHGYEDRFMESCILEQQQQQSQIIQPHEQQLQKGTAKFAFPSDQPPRQHLFLANNLSSHNVSPSPERKFPNEKYSYSWQRFLQTNKQMKQKLLKPHK